ncbi:MAG: TraB/GumN family protein [Flavobacteriales bacterium]|jgi:uncharacterized protein YbaP (TraB family)
MLRLSLPALVLWASALSAQPTPKSLLWRVSREGSVSTSYLYGTIHSRDNRAFQFGDSVMPAMARCSIVAGELDLEATRSSMSGLLGSMMLPDDQRLEDLYRKKDWKVVDAALKERFGPMATMLYRMKPFYVLALMTEGTEDGQGHSRMLDDELMVRGRNNGQRVIGLETMEEQFKAMDAIPLKEQANMLLHQVKEGKGEEQLDRMLEAYAMQDLDALFVVMEQQGGIPEAMEKALFTDRNHRMVQRLDSLMRMGEQVFFLVGAGHLPRANGLVELLRLRGYSVDPVFSVATRREEDVEQDR